MSIRILPPINAQERLARQRNLAALRQQGWDIGAFTQFFWTMSRGLDYDDTALKDIFNACLDDPVPKWEMDNLKILNYWDFSKYVCHRIQWGMPLPPPRPACSNHSTPLPLPSLDQHPLLTPTQKRRARRKRSQSAASINDSDTFPINQEPVKSHPIESVPVRLKFTGSVDSAVTETEFTIIPPESAELAADTTEDDELRSTCRKQRRGKAHAEQTLVPEVSLPVTLSPLSNSFMPSETVSAHSVMWPEAPFKPTPVMAKEAFTKPVSELDLPDSAKPIPFTLEADRPAPITPDPVKPIPVTLEPDRPTPITPDPVKPIPVTPEPAKDALVKSAPVIPKPIIIEPVISKMAKLAAIQSVPVNSKPESASATSESVITQSMKYAPGISESAKPTSCFPVSTECTPVIQESVKSNFVPQSIRSVPYLSQSAGSIPISAEMTMLTTSPPVLVESATDTTEAIQHTVATRHRRKKRKAGAVLSNSLPVLPIETMPEIPVMPTDCVHICHVSSTEGDTACHVVPPEALLEPAAPPVMATEANAVAIILPVMATEASSRPPALPDASTDAIPTSHVESKNVPATAEAFSETLASLLRSTEEILAALAVAIKTVQEPTAASERAVTMPAPERAVLEPAIEEIVPGSVPVSAPAPESAPVSAPTPVPSLVLASDPEEVSKSMSKSHPVTLKDTPVTQPSWRSRPVTPVPTPPFPPSMSPSLGSLRPGPPWVNQNFLPGPVPTHPFPPSVFPGQFGTSLFTTHPPPRLVPPVMLPGVDAWRRPLERGWLFIGTGSASRSTYVEEGTNRSTF
ncbi:proteoglycan 4-like protein [Labeo rohita]|uniref:Proteoglycan 4-like protein n=1 Tax=Labeo rohita TaxID=84645 RepID=A0A498MUA1_LABRO|nr:proteoglycan 4-like protein [Labeo rohita]